MANMYPLLEPDLHDLFSQINYPQLKQGNDSPLSCMFGHLSIMLLNLWPLHDTSWHWNAFVLTGHLCEESNCHPIIFLYKGEVI